MLYYITMTKNQNVLMQIGGVNIYVNDTNYEHFNSLPKSQQEAIKQTMILKMLKNEYD
jgi:hypothetical protein